MHLPFAHGVEVRKHLSQDLGQEIKIALNFFTQVLVLKLLHVESRMGYEVTQHEISCIESGNATVAPEILLSNPGENERFQSC